MINQIQDEEQRTLSFQDNPKFTIWKKDAFLYIKYKEEIIPMTRISPSCSVIPRRLQMGLAEKMSSTCLQQPSARQGSRQICLAATEGWLKLVS